MDLDLLELEMADDLSFDEWFDLFRDRVRLMGYYGVIDKYSFEWNYEEGQAPEDAAAVFVEEMNE